MLGIKHTVIEEIRTETVSKFEMVNKYYWSSGMAVLAVEFKENVHNKEVIDETTFHEVTLIKVKFKEDIILSKKLLFSEKYPLPERDIQQDWVKDLIYAFTHEDTYYDYRTKEEFDKDFQNVLDNLQKLR